MGIAELIQETRNDGVISQRAVKARQRLFRCFEKVHLAHPTSRYCFISGPGHVPIAGGLEIAARPRAVQDDGVATVVDGERLDYLGECLFFVHGASYRVVAAASQHAGMSAVGPYANCRGLGQVRLRQAVVSSRSSERSAQRRNLPTFRDLLLFESGRSYLHLGLRI
jgi:hypothetical protein